MTIDELAARVVDLERRLDDLQARRKAPFVAHSKTSRAAAGHVEPRRGTQAHKILEFLRSRGDTGATREEITHALKLSPDSVRPRIVELVDAGLVKPTSRTRRTLHGEQAEVLIVDPAPSAGLFDIKPSTLSAIYGDAA